MHSEPTHIGLSSAERSLCACLATIACSACAAVVIVAFAVNATAPMSREVVARAGMCDRGWHAEQSPRAEHAQVVRGRTGSAS